MSKYTFFSKELHIFQNTFLSYSSITFKCQSPFPADFMLIYRRQQNQQNKEMVGNWMLATMEIGMDLGTANTLVFQRNKGIIFNEPSVLAIDSKTNKVLAAGHEAQQMVGKTSKNIDIIYPLTNGVIADYHAITEFIKIVMGKISKTYLFRKPSVVISVPFHATTVDKKAIIEAVKSAGAKKTMIIDEPVAAAVGAGLPVEEPVANVIVDIGGGTTEAAIISFGGVVACHSIRIGGKLLDQDIIQYVRKNNNVLIGERTAEKVKIEIGHALVDHEELTMEVRGRDLVTGLPVTIALSSYDIQQAIKDSLLQILNTIKALLEDSPPELSGDIVDRGIILTGGGALLNGLHEWINKEIDVPVHLAANPLESVVLGTGPALKFIERIPAGRK